MSEPIFDATVRVHADMSQFEKEAKASVDRSTAELERQTNESLKKARLLSDQSSTAAKSATFTDTRPFEQRAQAAFAKTASLAQSAADAAARNADVVGANARKAVTAVADAQGFAAREQARGVAQVALVADREARKAASDAQAMVRQVLAEAESSRLKVASELSTRSQIAATNAQTAGLSGDVAGQRKGEFEAQVLAMQSASVTFRLQAQDLIGQAAAVSGSERELLLAQANNALVASEKLRVEALKLRETGSLPPEGGPGGPGAGGTLGKLHEMLGGRESGLAGLLGGAARFGLAGFAFTAAIESISEIQKSLRATGDEAFTAQGQLRNFGAELISGNIIAGFKALRAVKPDTFTGGLQEEIDRIKQSTDETIISAQKLQALQNNPTPRAAPKPGLDLSFNASVLDNVDAFLPRGLSFNKSLIDNVGSLLHYKDRVKGASDELVNFLDKEEQAGRITHAQNLEVQRATVSLDKQASTAELAANAWSDYAAAVERAGSVAKAFGPDSAGGPRGPGALPQPGTTGVPAGTVIGQQRTGIPRPIIAADRSVFEPGTGGPEVAARIRASIASRIQDENVRLQYEKTSALVQQKLAREAFEGAKKTAESNHQVDGAAKEWAAYVEATTAVVKATQAAKEGTKAAADAAQDLGNQVRDANVAAIADPAAQAQGELASARIKEQQAKKNFEEATKGTRAANEAWAAYQIATANRVGIENSIAATAKAAAQQAAETAAANKKAGFEQSLENNITAAALTKRKSDDKRAFDAAIAYWVNLRNNAKNTADQEAARAQVISLSQRRNTALHGSAPDISALTEANLQNKIATQQLQGIDPTATMKALASFYEKAAKGATGVEKAQLEAKAIAERAAIKGNEQQLTEARFANRAARAALTARKSDDLDVVNDQIAYYRALAKSTTGLEHEGNVTKLIAAQARKKALQDATEAGTGGPSTIDFLGISQKIFGDFAGNLFPTGSAAKSVRGLFPGLNAGAPEDKTPEEQLEELRAIRRAVERGPVGATVHVNQNFRSADQTGFAQARFARFAMEEAFNG